ncbi:hypothetical protein Shewmr4_2871 [Shewanella sp. MR-4]|nr:hypothetical protein Shewmr4_2871 [Shewanella sp. MR-4]
MLFFLLVSEITECKDTVSNGSGFELGLGEYYGSLIYHQEMCARFVYHEFFHLNTRLYSFFFMILSWLFLMKRHEIWRAS